MAGIESRAHFEHSPETPKQKSRARQQNNGERYLRNNKNARKPGMASAGAGPATSLPQIFHLVRIRRLEGRSQSEEHARENRNQESEGKHSGADVHFVEPRNIRGSETYDRIFQEKNREECDYTGNDGQERALRQQLERQSSAARTHRQPNRDLAPPSGRARQQKVGDIDASDEQHKSHRSEKDEQFRPLGPDQIFFHCNKA